MRHAVFARSADAGRDRCWRWRQTRRCARSSSRREGTARADGSPPRRAAGALVPAAEIVDGETPVIARTRDGSTATSPAQPPTSAICRSTCAARRSSSASGRRCARSRRARRPPTARSLGAGLARRLARRRHGQRRQPDRDHRPLPSRHRIERHADRLRRRPRAKDVADRPRTRSAGSHRAFEKFPQLVEGLGAVAHLGLRTDACASVWPNGG